MGPLGKSVKASDRAAIRDAAVPVSEWLQVGQGPVGDLLADGQ